MRFRGCDLGRHSYAEAQGGDEPSRCFSHCFLFSTPARWQRRPGWERARQKVGGNLGLQTDRVAVGKGLGHTQGGGCARSGCQGMHMCVHVCVHACARVNGKDHSSCPHIYKVSVEKQSQRQRAHLQQ